MKHPSRTLLLLVLAFAPACRQQNVTVGSRGPSLETPGLAGDGPASPAPDVAPPPADAAWDLGADRAPGLTDGLVGWWRFDDAGGERATDSSGRGNDGLAVQPPSAVAGRQGQAIDLTGSGAYLQVPSSVSINGVYRGLTLAAFVHQKVTRPERATILSRQGAYLLGLTGGRPFLSLVVEGLDRPIELSAGVTVPTGRWVHLAAVFDGTSARLYMDGRELASLAVTGTIGSSNVPVTIGARLQGTAVADAFGASLDEARLYARALTAAEIGTLANPD